MPLGGLLSAGIMAGGAVAGHMAQGEANRRQRDLLSESMGDQQTFDPELLKRVIYQKYAAGEQLSPELLQNYAIAESKAAAARGDVKALEEQQQALRSLREMARTGETAEGRAQRLKEETDLAAQARANQDAIMMKRQSQGVGPSAGDTLAAQLIAGQGATQNASTMAVDRAAKAEALRQQAMYNYGQAQGDVSKQSYTQQFQTGSAADALEKLRNENLRETARYNVNAANTAKEFNINRANKVADANIENQNRAIDLEREARYKRMGIDASNINARNAARKGMGEAAVAEGNRQAGMWNSIGQFGGGMMAKVPWGSGSSSARGVPEEGFGNDYDSWMKYAKP